MGYKLIYAEEASNDLDGIFETIKQDNPERAITFVAEIEKAISHLARFPLMGRERSKSNRQVIHGNYRIVYAVNVKSQTVTVKHVKNCARNEQNYIS